MSSPDPHDTTKLLAEWDAAIAAAYPQYPSIQVERVKKAGNALRLSVQENARQLAEVTQDRNEWRTVHGIALQVVRETGERLVAAEAEKEALAARVKSLVKKYDHTNDECEGQCVPDRNAVVADLRSVLAAVGEPQGTEPEPRKRACTCRDGGACIVDYCEHAAEPDALREALRAAKASMERASNRLPEGAMCGVASSILYDACYAIDRALAIGDVDCERCHGNGTIEVGGYSIIPSSGVLGRDPQCDTTHGCPDCYGTGIAPRALAVPGEDKA